MPTTGELVDAIKRATAVSALEEDESEPYRHKYEAADMLKALLGERALNVPESSASGEVSSASRDPATPADATDGADIAAEAAHASGSAIKSEASPQPSVPAEPAVPSPEASSEAVAAAAAQIRCGLILLETDLLPDGEAHVMAGLPLLEKSPDAYLAWLLESYNSLGALYSQRGDFPTALQWLQKSEDLYRRVTGTGARRAHLAHLPISGREQAAEAEAAAPAPASTAAPAEAAASAAGTETSPAPEGVVATVPETAGAVATAPKDSEGDGGGPGSGDRAREEQEEQQQQQQQQEEEEEEDGGRGSTAKGLDQEQEAGGSGRVQDEDQPATSGPVGGGDGSGSGSCGPKAATLSAGTAAVGDPEPSTASAVTEQQQQELEQQREEAGQRAAVEGVAALSLAQKLPDNDDDAVQSQYTSTLYFMAQVYGHMKVSDRSALYCAATLYRQLASGKYDLDTWVNNCLQLGGYYAKVHAYGLAMYCHAAAQAVADRDTAAGSELGDDIAANIKLAAARVYNMRLAASHAKYIEGKDLEMHYPDVSYFPDYLRFSGLVVPSPDSFPWGLAALTSTFEGARELLNAGMPYFKEALSYYQLDGWVTDHVGIIMDMSNMYRCLASFEADPGRAAAMHRCRAQLLEPLSGALNPDHYPGLSRSIDLELAHVFREISDVRELQPGQDAKAAAAAASATKFYQRFLRSFTVSDSGQMPDRVDLDNEPYFLMASFGLGRMMQRLKGGTGTGAGDAALQALLMAAHQHLQWTNAYVKRHGLEAWTQEAQAAEELSELLVERMRLHAMAAARKGA